MSFELLKNGCLIMIIGMGVVYLFIAIMIYVMEFMAKFMKFINKYFPEEIEEEITTKKINTQKNNDADIALAIACAINQKKEKKVA